MTFICYPKCTTCQKAQKWLDENGISYTFRDIKTEHPSNRRDAGQAPTAGGRGLRAGGLQESRVGEPSKK